MHGEDNVYDIPKEVPVEIPLKISCPCNGRCVLYTEVEFWELLNSIIRNGFWYGTQTTKPISTFHYFPIFSWIF